MYNTNNILLTWYDANKRILPWRDYNEPYNIWLSEVMLQQTQVKTVVPYYTKWIKKFPTLKSVAESDLNSLLKLWEGLGYYSRCRNFHKATQIVVEKYKSVVPNDYKLFCQLPGVGDYIASAVLSIAYNKKYPAVDANLKRVISRYLGIKKLTRRNTLRIHNQLNKMLTNGRPGDINQALMDVGSLICKPNDVICIKCPLINKCKGYSYGNPIMYPDKNKRKPIPTKEYVAVFISYNDHIFINQRSEDGLLGGLWELPMIEVFENSNKIKALKTYAKNKLGLSIDILNCFDKVKHSYSHYKLLVTPFACEVSNIESKIGHWIRVGEIHKYAFSKVNHKLFNAIGIKNY